MKYSLSLLFLVFVLTFHAQVPVYKEPKGKSKTEKPPKSPPERKSTYYDDAQKQKKSDEIWLDGKLHGKCIYYYQSGKIQRSGFYKLGKEDSLWLFYYDNGKLKAQENFYNGKKSGPAKYWYPGGEPFLICRYVENLPDSTWVSYYENGNVKSKEQYKITFHN